MSVAEALAPFTEDSTSRTVQTKRWKLHYNEVGAGSPIILLHGTGPGATGVPEVTAEVGLDTTTIVVRASSDTASAAWRRLPGLFRADVVTDGNKAEDIVANAPATDRDFLMVPKVVE